MKGNILIYFSLIFSISACTKVETEPYDCVKAAKPTFIQSTFNTSIGSIVKAEVTNYFDCYWVGPDSFRFKGQSAYIPISSAAKAGLYKVYTYKNNCVSDSGIVTINTTGTTTAPCAPSNNRYSVDIYNYNTTFFDLRIDNYSNILSTQTCYISFLDNSSFSNTWLRFEFLNNKTPEHGKAYFIDSAYNLPKDATLIMYGSDASSGHSWRAKSGVVYCNQLGNNTSLTFCNVIAILDGQTEIKITGKVIF
jgi:hypothetical protein